MLLRLVLIVGAFALAAAVAGCGVAHSSSAPPSSPGSTASAGPRAVVQAYWNDITSGRYRAAFRRFDSAERKRSHGEQWFVNDKARDAPIRARVHLGAAAVSGELATVPIVSLRTVGGLTGCHRWTGSYRLRKFSAGWLIDAANIHKHSC